jgi:hypothetical protein
MLKHTLITAFTLASLTAGVTSPVQAADNDITLDPALLQSEFNTLVEEMGTAVSYNPVSPAEPLGITGFEAGIVVTMVDIDDNIWSKAVSDADAPSMLPVPRLMVRKGLPFGVDVGLAYTKVPGSNIKIIGGELRKAILEGSAATPAVTVLGHTSSLSGVDDVDISAYGIDVGVSKGFAIFTPYAGIGQVWIDGSENAGIGLADHDTSETRSYLGVRIGFMPLLNLVAQADFSVVNSYSLRLNLGF